jgi:ribosomal protein S18 acetylase RimI-like enzyme
MEKGGVIVEQITIRPVKHNDVEAIEAVALSSWKHTYGAIYPESVIEQFVSNAYSLERLLAAIERDSQRSHKQFLVATDGNGKIIAFAQVARLPDNHSSFELLRIYSLPNVQGSGVGIALLNYIFESIPMIDELNAWVEQENYIGRRFYERHGFKVTDQKEEDFYGFNTVLLKYKFVR